MGSVARLPGRAVRAAHDYDSNKDIQTYAGVGNRRPSAAFLGAKGRIGEYEVGLRKPPAIW
jgi:hypothetical protein